MATNSRLNQDLFSNARFLELANRAVAEAVEKHRRLGQPIVVMRDGEIVWLSPEEIPPYPLPHDSLPAKVLAERSELSPGS